MKRFVLAIAAMVVAVFAAMADSAPVFPGGDEALNNYLVENMKYPQTAIDNGIEGVVTVQFTVQADGSIGAIKITRMIDPDLEQEAIRLVKNMPAWTPAEKNGTPTAENVTIPIKFSLPSE